MIMCFIFFELNNAQSKNELSNHCPQETSLWIVDGRAQMQFHHDRGQPCRLWPSRGGIESILRSLKLLLRLTQLSGDEVHSLSALLPGALLLFNRRLETCLCFPNLDGFGSVTKLIWNLKHSGWS